MESRQHRELVREALTFRTAQHPDAYLWVALLAAVKSEGGVCVTRAERASEGIVHCSKRQSLNHQLSMLASLHR